MWIGLDPGQSGGIGFIREDGVTWAEKMPETDKDLSELLSEKADSWAEVFACLESVHSMPGQGVASSFKFGEGFGKLQMALCCNSIPYDRVTPQKWQKELSCLTKGDKNVSKRRAQELFPMVPRITHNIADALLIAKYCQIKHP